MIIFKFTITFLQADKEVSSSKEFEMSVLIRFSKVVIKTKSVKFSELIFSFVIYYVIYDLVVP